MKKKFNIIQIWERVCESENTFKQCFKIVGELYGYSNLSDAESAREILKNKDHCVIMKIWW